MRQFCTEIEADPFKRQRNRRERESRYPSYKGRHRFQRPWKGGTKMPDRVLASRATAGLIAVPSVAGALERAAAAIARLNQALGMHPLLPAFLYRTRLEAVRRQAAVDGQAIDPWHLAAVLQGLRLRMDGALRIIDRGMIVDAVRIALSLHQWITAPDFDQEGEVRLAERELDRPSAITAPLLSAAFGMHAWLSEGGTRAPIRAALVRHWMRHRLLRARVPLTGPRALGADMPFEPEAWLPIFLDALADEATDYLQLLFDMERNWLMARAAVAGRRSTSRAATAVDIMAAAPLVSATTLAGGLGMAVKNATALLVSFAAAGVAVEVTHRSRRRLFGLSGLAPLRDGVRSPPRPEPGRGRGRPPILRPEPVQPIPMLPDRSLVPLERRACDYGELEHCMAQLEHVIRQTRRSFDVLAHEVPAFSRTSWVGDEVTPFVWPAPSIEIDHDPDRQGRTPEAV
jgi:hypothetical protein